MAISEFAYFLFVTFSAIALSNLSSDAAADQSSRFGNVSPLALRKSLQRALPGFMKGVPQLGITPLDPFRVDRLDLKLPGGLTISFRQGVATGFKNCLIDSASLVEDTMEVMMHCNMTIKGKYRSSGRLLLFPVNGDGDTLIKCQDINFVLTAKLNAFIGDDGREYLKIDEFKASHSFEGQIVYDMTNIFNGNPELSQVVLEFMNKNWKIVAEEFGKPIVDYGVAAMLSNMDRLLEQVSLSEITNNPESSNHV